MTFAARYSDVVQLVVRLRGVPPARLTALRGRLQHLQKLGYPRGVNTGRGKPAEYGAGQVLMLILALEFVALGITPDRAAKVLRKKEPKIAEAVRVSSTESQKDEPDAVYIRVEPTALFDEDPHFGFSTARSLERFLRLSTHLSGFTSHALINLSAVIERIHEWSAKELRLADDQFREALADWARGVADVDPEA